MAVPPPVTGVLETVLYYTDQARTERFYGATLGFRLVGKEAGRHLFFRAGSSLLLLFNSEATSHAGAATPSHGAAGSVHTCFLAAPQAYESWKEHLARQGIAILKEAAWSEEGRSFYFRDPDDNLLEIANLDFWPP
jgi:catechol 2,3-dioxygenase-like lactoylglutathione lyase family enzyme